MGLDPEHPDYEPGVPCPVCEDILFDGVTPKYVECVLSGIERCPGSPDEDVNGTYLLEQQPDPCLWWYFSAPISIRWRLGGAASRLEVWRGVESWFDSTVLDVCFDAFVNGNVCGVWPAIGHEGYAVLWWGPTIGP